MCIESIYSKRSYNKTKPVFSEHYWSAIYSGNRGCHPKLCVRRCTFHVSTRRARAGIDNRNRYFCYEGKIRIGGMFRLEKNQQSLDRQACILQDASKLKDDNISTMVKIVTQIFSV
uniref:Uncharacterized protein n=1 Tax=Romanomermis culicivorax TaxID=13658 RepID=A0A915LA47_ROMCU